MAFDLFRNASGNLRHAWWIAIFLVLLLALLVPLILLNQHNAAGVPIWQQALALLAASLTCQVLRRRPLAELFGAIGPRWLAELGVGGLIGVALMAAPASLLALTGAVVFSVGPVDGAALGGAFLLFAAVAATEELMFRGFAFQRLLDAAGAWPAQLVTSFFFVLTHSAALQDAGALAAPAALNIFLASLMFGFAFIRTRSLAMPIGMHLMANFMQGAVLGFGVSGNAEQGWLSPNMAGPDWLTGGAFGLEASVPGLIAVTVTLAALIYWRRPLADGANDVRSGS